MSNQPRRWKSYDKLTDRERRVLISEALYLLRTGLIDEETGFGRIAERVERKKFKRQPWVIKHRAESHLDDIEPPREM